MPPADAAPPEYCALENRVFTALGEVRFERSPTDNTPVMMVTLGDRSAGLPLRSLQREFAIADELPDGRMLGLIAEALDFVPLLRIGDRFPDEVLTGKASWRPMVQHFNRASGRLRLRLMAWAQGGDLDGSHADEQVLEQLEADAKLRERMDLALARAAVELKLADAAAVNELLDAAAEELSYIEALRDDLLVRAQAMAQRIETLSARVSAANDRGAVVLRVGQLLGTALQALSTRFADVDAQTGEALATLRNLESQRVFIRSNRDWLYRTLRAWEPVLRDWRDEEDVEEPVYARVSRAYQFLAARYMPVHEWEAANALRGKRGAVSKERTMTW